MALSLRLHPFMNLTLGAIDSNNPFLNQALLIKTNISPEKVLETCLSIEAQLGRTRNENGTYADRNIDIDILLFEELIISNETLEIPHPRMHQRSFVWNL